MSESPLDPEEPPGAQGEDERLAEDADEVPREGGRDRDDAPGISGPEHLGLTPPG